MVYNLYPAVDDVTYEFPPVVRTALGKSQELRNTVVPMPQADRNNLSGTELWNGRLIFNTTTNKINRYESGVPGWFEIDSDNKVLRGGDTMTGDLTLSGQASPSINVVGSSYPTLNLDSTSGAAGFLRFKRSGNTRWALSTVNYTETGSNEGNDFSIQRFNDDGTYINSALIIDRSTGLAKVLGDPDEALGVATKQYVDNEQTESTLTLSSGYADYGSAYAGLYVTRNGNICTIDCLITRTGSALTTTQGGIYNIATIPSGFRPAHGSISACIYSYGAASSTYAGRITANPDGVLAFVPYVAGSMPTSTGWIAVSTSYRAA